MKRSIYAGDCINQVFHDVCVPLKRRNLYLKNVGVFAPKRIYLFLVCFLFLFQALFGCAISERRILVRDHEKPAMVLPEVQDRSLQGPYIIDGVQYYCLSGEEGYSEEGIASWYGGEFHGRNTANGEVYDMHKKTAAHKTLPFGTYVKVMNLSNSKEVVVRINDRGPFVKGRLIDLSFAAAKDIGLIAPGTAKVQVIALSRKVGRIKIGDAYKPLVEVKNFRKGKFTAQVGAFKVQENAERLAERLRVLFDHVTITTYVPRDGTIFYRVRVSLSEDLNEINQIVEKLEYLGFSEAFIVAL